MILMAVIYFLSAVVVLLFPTELLYVVNLAPVVLKFAEPIPLPGDRLWVVMASSWLFLLAFLALFAARNPVARGYFWIQAVSLAISGSALFYFFFREHPYFAYFLFGLIHCGLALFLTWKGIRGPKTPRKSPPLPEAQDTTQEISL